MEYPDERRVGVVVYFHPFEEGASGARDSLTRIVKFAKALPCQLLPWDVPVSTLEGARKAARFFSRNEVDYIILHLVTWCDDNLLLEHVSWCNAPIITMAEKGVNTGSLCGCQQFNMVLKEVGFPTAFLLGNDDQSLAAIMKVLDGSIHLGSPLSPRAPGITNGRLRKVLEDLSRLRIGLLGSRTQGMMEVAFSEFDILETFGVIINAIPVDIVKDRAAAVEDGKVEAIQDQFMDAFKNPVVESIKESMEDAARIHAVLSRLIYEKSLGALTVECYPRFMGKACLSFSLLSQSGITCTCEGDVNATILGWLIQRLSGSPVNHVDLLDVDFASQTMTGGHCGACAIGLASDETPVKIAPVRLAGHGACILFPTRPGSVTIANLVGRKGTYRAFIMKGKALPTKMVFPGNPTTIKLPVTIQEFLDIVGSHGFGHHWIVGYGDGYCKDLARLLEGLGIKVLARIHESF
ncbi:hypothetical protein GF325_16535 [Candidatus Bathyarchaeota archaeon]|nr:hypothetical protein [Candidatus Bathyarchaeota archaeon]